MIRNTRKGRFYQYISGALGLALLLSSCFFDVEVRPVQSGPETLEEESETLERQEVSQTEADPYLDPVGYFGIDLSIPQVFAITRPAGEITTDYDSYFITGTSDPEQPVYFEDEEIVRQGTKGVFGVHVELEEGENIFRFRQGDETAEVIILHPADDGEDGIGAIDQITQSSMFPAAKAGVNAGQALPVSCIAPSGARVTAVFGGVTARLEQAAATAVEGVAATFLGELPIGWDYPEGETSNAGPVTYLLEYDGEETEYQSSGDVYVAGDGASIVLEVSSYLGFVYPDTGDLSVFREKLKRGAVDYLKNQNNKYFELASGGFLPVDMADIVEGRIQVEHTLDDVTMQTDARGETYIFHGVGSPAYHSRVLSFLEETGQEEGDPLRTEEETRFLLTLYNTFDSPAAPWDGSNLFERIDGSQGDTSVTYTFSLRDGARLWGYNIAFEEDDLVLRFRYRPELSGIDGRPLEGIRFLIDPGHGGTDAGAFGLPGQTGPSESDINLAHAFAVGSRLEKLGGTVLYTREQDEYYSLDDRLEDIETLNADFFLSVHHNSVAERSDANDISGMEVYYHDGLSQQLADSMLRGLEINLDRKSRFVEQSYYRVTLLPYAPSILMELGFMSNPLEYEKLTDWQEIEQVAVAVVDGVLITLMDL